MIGERGSMKYWWMVLLVLVSGATCDSETSPEDNLATMSLTLLPGFGPTNGDLPVDSCAGVSGCHNFPSAGGRSSPVLPVFGGMDQNNYWVQKPGEARGTFAFTHEYKEGHNDAPKSARRAPPLWMAPVLESISNDALLALEDPDDLNGDGIRLFASKTGDGKVHKFFWQSQRQLNQYANLDARTRELGLKNTDIVDPAACEVWTAICDRPCNAGAFDQCMAEQIAKLPVPDLAQVGTPEQRALGEQLTAENCGGCHIPVIDGQEVWGSGGLLIDMGPALDDEVITHRPDPNFTPATSMWRAPSLCFASSPYLHDGRAPNLRSAVDWHATGDAAPAKKAFFNDLTEEEREAIEAFILSNDCGLCNTPDAC